LVSWARLVAGRYRDPIVGRDLLAGGVFAATIVLLFRVAAGLAGTGRFDPASASWIGCMSGLRDTLSIVASLAAVSMVSTVLFFTTLLVLRILLRRSLPAVIGAVLVYGGVTSALFHSWNLPFAPVLGMTWAAAGAFLAIRFGFLALLSGIFLRFVALVVPWTFDVSSWVSELSLVGAVVVLGIVGYGFITALGGQRLLPDLVSEAGDRLPRAERRS
jgi:hypothetical protein